MRRRLPTVLAPLALAAPLAGQAKPDHVYGVGVAKARRRFGRAFFTGEANPQRGRP